jgi:hypothetical protein
MSQSCEQHRDTMVAFLRGELGPLERRRVEAHLDNCDDCTTLRGELELGLEAAAAWHPELPAERLDDLIARLIPYMERRGARRTFRPGWAVASLAAAAALLIALGGVILSRRSVPEPEPAVAVAPEPVPLEPVVAPVQHAEPAPWLRVVTPAGWDGKVTRDGRAVEIAMQHGFVAVSFVGGRGRKVRVRAPNATVDVVGTRFFVEIGDGGATHVGVAEGRVRLTGGRGTVEVAAGQTLSIDAGGLGVRPETPLVASRHLDDAYLLEHRAEVAAARRTRRVAPLVLDMKDTDLAIEAGAPDSSEMLALLERAEELALDGRAREAAEIYDACMTSSGASFAPYRALCSFELARLIGFQLGEPARARRIFIRLIREAPAEVERQAQLALCELDLASEPCLAAACLRNVAGRSGADATLRREAERLLERWGLEDRGCGAKR